ncbi:hypothetical protein PO640_18925 [Citrobacter freundii]|uniref:hypothetical protein n=1 Tax=Citrobacter freundii TaxID=546 RepID=UPI002FF76084
MAKPALFDFSNATASEIVSAIDAKITTSQNLHAFRNRVPGGAKKADKLYPQTREAMNIIKGLRQKAKNAKTIKGILRPYSAELAKCRDVLDIIKPVIGSWKEFYFSRGIGLTDEQVLILKMIECAGELESMTGRAIPYMTISA